MWSRRGVSHGTQVHGFMRSSHKVSQACFSSNTFCNYITTRRAWNPRVVSPVGVWKSSQRGTTVALSTQSEAIEVYCAGCGVELQTENQYGSGYLPQSEALAAAREQLQKQDSESNKPSGSMERSRLQQHHGIICQRCYQNKHYGSLVPPQLPYESFEQYLDGIRPLDCLVVQLIDVFDFHGSIIHNLTERIGNKPVVLVLNKCDLLPKRTNFDRLKQWARTELKKMGVDNVEEVACISAQRGTGMEDALDNIKKHRKGRDVYIIGTANVGKSTFVNRILHRIWTGSASASPYKRKKENKGNYAVLLDELPEGYEVNDTYTGDMNDLVRESYQMNQLKKMDSATLNKLGIKEEGSPFDRRSAQQEEVAPVENPATRRSPQATNIDEVEEEAWKAIQNKKRIKRSEEKETPAPAISVSSNSPSNASVDRQGRPQGQQHLVGTGDGPYTGAVSSAISGSSNLPSPLRPLPFEEAANLVGGDSQRATKGFGNSEEEMKTFPLTTSPLPGTTLGVVGAPLVPGGTSRLFDTPGIIVNEKKQQLMEYLSTYGQHTLRQVLPQKPLRLTNYSIRPGRTMFLGGLVRIDYFHPMEDTNMLFTPATNLRVHITSAEKADTLWEKHRNDLDKDDPLLFPTFGDLNQEYEFDLVDSVPWLRKRIRHGDPFHGGSPKRTRARRQQRVRHSIVDIAIDGLGWVSVTPIEVKGMLGWERAVGYGNVRVRTVDGLDVHFRQPILPHEGSGTKPRQWRRNAEPRALRLDKSEQERKALSSEK